MFSKPVLLLKIHIFPVRRSSWDSKKSEIFSMNDQFWSHFWLTFLNFELTLCLIILPSEIWIESESWVYEISQLQHKHLHWRNSLKTIFPCENSVQMPLTHSDFKILTYYNNPPLTLRTCGKVKTRNFRSIFTILLDGIPRWWWWIAIYRNSIPWLYG